MYSHFGPPAGQYVPPGAQPYPTTFGHGYQQAAPTGYGMQPAVTYGQPPPPGHSHTPAGAPHAVVQYVPVQQGRRTGSCGACGQPGHWASDAECPARNAGNQNAGSMPDQFRFRQQQQRSRATFGPDIMDRYESAVQSVGALTKENKELRQQLDELQLKNAQKNQRKRTKGQQRQQNAAAREEAGSDASDSSMAVEGEQRALRRDAAAGVAAAAAAAADSEETAAEAADPAPFVEVVRRGSRRGSAPPAVPAAAASPVPSPGKPQLQAELVRALQDLPRKTKAGVTDTVRKYGPDSMAGGIRLAEVYKALMGRHCVVPEKRTDLINMISNAIYAKWDDLVTENA